MDVWTLELLSHLVSEVFAAGSCKNAAFDFGMFVPMLTPREPRFCGVLLKYVGTFQLWLKSERNKRQTVKTCNRFYAQFDRNCHIYIGVKIFSNNTWKESGRNVSGLRSSCIS
jgi:hypothetical protein